MQLGIFAKTFAGTEPGPVLQAARKAGFSTVQYNMACSGLGALPDSVPIAVAETVAAAAEGNGVTIAAVSATYNMLHPDPANRIAGRAAFTAIAKAARAISAQLLTLCSGSLDAADQWRHHPDNGSEAAWRGMREELDRLLVIAEDEDILLGIEPELGNVVSSAGAAARLLREAGSKRVRIVFDPANLFETATAQDQRRIIEQGLDLLGGSIALAHAKDRRADGGFAAAGQGVIDWPHCLRALSAAGFRGAVVAHGLTAEEAPMAARALQRALGA